MTSNLIPKHENYCTLLRIPEDRDILTRRLFDVNMRLFNNNEGYRNLVLHCCEYIRIGAETEKEGYSKPYGFSGANAGVPFNIIATADGTVFINPKIVETSWNMVETLSNCGSLLLPEPIKIKRYANVKVTYFDIMGNQRSISGRLATLQHEIDHNNGILITDRATEAIDVARLLDSEEDSGGGVEGVRS